MNIINQATNYFVGEEFFGDVIAVNVTCMMVLASIYVAVSASLPDTSDIKTIEIWLLFSLIYPFLVVLVNTYIHVKRSKIKQIKITRLDSTNIGEKKLFSKILRKMKAIKFAEFVANYLLPIIFIIFTVTYYCYFVSYNS